MPIREFVCPSGHRTELIDLKRQFDTPTMDCPTCGASAARVVSASNWQVGEGHTRNHSETSRAIDRVRRAEREGRA
jgi:predicted nucleic acid-binding Zn ribbon protein